MIFYFSGTGNSAYVASIIAQKLNDRLIAINEIWQTKQWSYTLQEGEKLGFIFPVHAWGPPILLVKVIRHLILAGNSIPYCYLICTCGDDIGCTVPIMRHLLKKKGWELSSGYSITMPNTYVCLPGFDVDKDEIIKTKLSGLSQRLPSISNHIMKKRKNYFEIHPGGLPRIKSYVIRPLFNRFLLKDKPFYSNEQCIGCSICAQVCPVNNIEMKKRKPVWKGECTMCLRCFHSCPQHAIHYGRLTKGKGQYLKKNYN